MSEFDENKPYWWVVAEDLIGHHEKTDNGQDNPAIFDIYTVCNTSQAHDEIAWSAAFVGACLELSGFASTNAMTAISYKDFGKKLELPVKGCIVLFHRMTSSQGNTGHVGFYSHTGDDGKIYCLGGHQGDNISVAGFPRKFLRDYRWPTKVGSLPAPRPLHLRTIDSLTDDIPPHLFQPTTLPSSPIKNTQWHGETGGINDCIPLIISVAGGFVNHPQDLDGATNMGITQDTLRAYRKKSVTVQDVMNLTKSEASEIYKKKYWDINSCDSLPKPLALLTFNASVSFDPHRGAVLLQETLNLQDSHLLIDGDIGPKTIAATQRIDMKQAIVDFTSLQRTRHNAGRNTAFIGDLLNRMDRIQRAAEEFNPITTMIEPPPAVTPPVIPLAIPLVKSLAPIEEPMSDQIALSQAEFAAIVEVAVREAVRKSTPVAITPVIEPAKPVTSEEVRAIITESQKVTFQSNIASNSLAPTIVTAIDRTLGGKMFAGKKTLIAVAAAVTGAVLAKLGYVSANISDIINIVAAGLGAAGVLSKIDRVIEGRILEK